MRGGDVNTNTAALFSYLSCEGRVPADHPLRAVRVIVDAALEGLSSEFETLYSPIGRPSIAPEKLLRALLLQAFYSVRSERQLMEQLDYNLLFRWFVGLGMDAPIWDVTVFTKNRERLLAGDVAAKFLAMVLNQPRVKALLSDEHFSVDGTLIEAWASMKSFKPRVGGEGPRRWRGQRWPAEGPQCRARLPRREARQRHPRLDHRPRCPAVPKEPAPGSNRGRGKEARLCHMGHLLMENRHGLIVDATLSHASGTAERKAAMTMLGRLDGRHRITLGADKAYDVAEFIDRLRAIRVTPHVAQNIANRRSAIDGRTTRHPGYAVSQRIRKRIEEAFGWNQNQRRTAENPAPRQRPRRLDLRPNRRRL